MLEDKNQKVRDIFDDGAEKYYEKYFDVSLYKRPLDLLGAALQKLETVWILDIGCGPGNLSAYLSAQCSQSHVVGVDFAPKMLDLARQRQTTGTFYEMKTDQLSTLDQRFELFLLGFITPYLSGDKVQKLLRDIDHMARPDAVLYLSGIEDRDRAPQYLAAREVTTYHPLEWILSLLSDKGWVILYQEKLIHGPDEEYVLVAKKRTAQL